MARSVVYRQCFARGIKLSFPYCLLWVDCSQKRNKEKKTCCLLSVLLVESTKSTFWAFPDQISLLSHGQVLLSALILVQMSIFQSPVPHIPFKQLQVVQRTTALAKVQEEGRAAECWVQAENVGSGCHCKPGCSPSESSTVLHRSTYTGKVSGLGSGVRAVVAVCRVPEQTSFIGSRRLSHHVLSCGRTRQAPNANTLSQEHWAPVGLPDPEHILWVCTTADLSTQDTSFCS